jgi:LAS superfamily LD-carboxypeptidase LdcB
MNIDTISFKGIPILLATILCIAAFTSSSRANTTEFALKEVFSKSQNEPGEAFYFFIPQVADDKNQYAYVYDTKLDRLLLFPDKKEIISKIEGQDINLEDWPGLLNKFILNGRDSSRLKVIELDDDWVKFTLDGRHIVLPRELSVEDWGQKNFPLGKEIVDKETSLPEDYIPDDLIKIHQKWNFHTPDNPKYLRKYVARMIEHMLRSAEGQGVHIRVFSAFRSYDKQRYLYLKAVSRYGENQSSVAKQGHSEHQLGTTVDLCGLEPKTVLNLHFARTKEGQWLRENASKFGFYQSYTLENQYLTGYIPEPWHYRFYGFDF